MYAQVGGRLYALVDWYARTAGLVYAMEYECIRLYIDMRMLQDACVG